MTDAESQLLHTCDQWRALSLLEGQAIRAADWPVVEKCQATKLVFQSRITAASAAWRLQAARQGETAAVEARLRAVIGDLLGLERQNETALAAHFRRARQEETGLTQSRRNLRQVHRAYSGALKAGWQSYS